MSQVDCAMQSKSESRCTNAASRRLVVYFVSILIPGLLIVFCSSCSNLVFGVDGEDTVDAADAAGQMNQAITAKLAQCLRESSGSSTTFPPGGPCVGALVTDRLLKKGDVETCVATLLSWQCPAASDSTGMYLLVQGMNQYAIKCPVKSVPFLINDVGPSWQGNILSLTMDEPVFYYACF